jgi:RimJ/RimL family protein N-acetyltransferase
MSNYFAGVKIDLRQFEPDDQAELARIVNHPLFRGRRYIPWGFPDELDLTPQQIEAVLKQWIEAKNELHLAIIDKAAGRLAGYVEFSAEWDPHTPSVSVVVMPDFQSRHVGTEAVSLVIQYCFATTPAHCITCWVAGWNEAGLSFARSLGFKDAGCMRRAGIREGKYFDTRILDLLRPEWNQRHGGSYGA